MLIDRWMSYFYVKSISWRWRIRWEENDDDDYEVCNRKFLWKFEYYIFMILVWNNNECLLFLVMMEVKYRFVRFNVVQGARWEERIRWKKLEWEVFEVAVKNFSPFLLLASSSSASLVRFLLCLLQLLVLIPSNWTSSTGKWWNWMNERLG